MREANGEDPLVYSPLCERPAVKYAWIKAHTHCFPVGLMCTLLNVGRSSYYDWLAGQIRQTERNALQEQLVEQIRAVFIRYRGCYGARRIKRVLNSFGIIISRRRVAKLMRQAGLACKTKRRFKVTTDSNHQQPVAPNLLKREFTAAQPNQKYVGDITYIWTGEGWLYLAVVIDLYSRRVVGWAMANHMRAELVNDALLMALWQRKPAAGLIWHTDRGSQYASESHRQIISDHGLVQSMSRRGNCWDNAVSESFFHTLKTELTHHVNFKTKEEAKSALFEYIEVFYNRQRMHSSNDYLSPVAYEMKAHNF